MDLKTVMARVLAGEVLNEAERRELSLCEFVEPTEAEASRYLEQVKTAEAERDAARRELEELRCQHQVAELATRHGFSDPDYLGFLLSRDQISPLEAEVAENYIAELKSRTPKLFALDLKPGTGPLPAPAATPLSCGNPADELAKRLEAAPEITF